MNNNIKKTIIASIGLLLIMIYPLFFESYLAGYIYKGLFNHNMLFFQILPFLIGLILVIFYRVKKKVKPSLVQKIIFVTFKFIAILFIVLLEKFILIFSQGDIQL